MKFSIFNTLGRQKQDFVPIDPKQVWIYSCGPTVYSTPHIWNMRACIFANLIRNIIQKILWYNVLHVMNITDVGHLTDDWDDWEDKLEKAAVKESKSAYEIADFYEKVFFRYLKELDLDFDIFPRATEHIQEQIDMISSLEKSLYTYIIPDDWVYMDTSKVKDYWKLLPPWHLDWLMENARVYNDQKRNKTDFALWKFSLTDEKRQMERDSPWWKWFPGWHIECSAMSIKYLWGHFDIHSGWVDHIPVHHSNEIAQSECCTNKKRVNYRVHNEHLNLKNQKMSKSSWQIVSLDSLSERWISWIEFKYFIYLAHYRNIQVFTYEDIAWSSKSYKKTKNKLQNLNQDIESLTLDKIHQIYNERSKWYELLDYILDDMDTVKTIAHINKILSSEDISKQEIALIKYLDEHVLKLHLFDLDESNPIPEEIENLAKQRLQAKSNKDFLKADELRDKIEQNWYTVRDLKDWYELSKK